MSRGREKREKSRKGWCPWGLTLFGLLLVLPSWPATPLDPGRVPSQYLLQSWQAEQGLPQDTVQAITQTPDGYLWVGTQEGLARFDGVKFVPMGPKTGRVSSRSSIVSLLATRDGSLWAGTNGSGLLQYRNGKFQTYSTRDGLADNHVWALLEDDDGSLWIGTEGGGLGRLTAGRFESLSVRDGLSSDRIRTLAKDRFGVLWIGTSGYGLNRLENGKVTVYKKEDGLCGDTIRALALEPSGALWIGTSGGGLCRFFEGRFENFGAERGLPTDQLASLFYDRRGSLWVGTWGKGLYRYRGGVFAAAGVGEDLANAHIWSLFEDREGNLWVGTWVGGLERLRDSRFATFTIREGLSSNNTRVVCQDGKGVVWVGTGGGGLCQIENGVAEPFRGEGTLSSEHVSSLLPARDGTLWIGTNTGGLNRLKGGRIEFVPLPGPVPRPDIRDLKEDAAGRVWVAAIGGGLFMKDGNGFRLFRDADGLPSNRVLSLLPLPDGSLLIGTAGAGLVRLDTKTWRFEVLGEKDGISQDRILALHLDDDGSVWAGTSGRGLIRYRNGRFSRVTSAQGLADDLVQVILEDGRDGFWMTSNRGVSRVRESELNEVADGSRRMLSSTLFGVSDGLRSPSCAGGQQPSGWLDSSGLLWIPTYRGLVQIDPSRMLLNEVPPPVLIESLHAGKEVFEASEPVLLPPGSPGIEIHYTATSLQAPEKVRFRYRLSGYDADWVDAGSRRVAYYSNLSPGTYTFRVMAANNDGIWNEAGAVYSFQLAPFFHQTWWFWGLAIVVVSGGGWAGYRWRVRSLERQQHELMDLVDERTRSLREEKARAEHAFREAERAREEAERLRAVAEEAGRRAEEANRSKSQFLANTTHELRTPLNAIIGYAEMLSEDADEAGLSGFTDDLRKIRTAARHQLELVNSILDLSKIEAGRMDLGLEAFDVSEVLEDVTSLLTPLLEKNRNRLERRILGDLGTMYSDATKVRQALFNVLSNATKFTHDGLVTLTAERLSRNGNGWLRFEIRDTGIGIPGAHLERLFQPFTQVDASTSRRFGGTGLGLAITREFCRLMGGEIFVRSEEGRGTEFTLELPAELSQAALRTPAQQT
ncbi:MAG: Sensor histidine kinase RcsC [Thermoanaerobaculia bacterium]|nr:Sensor histidine kinase RcsC [Thermoanaerobaculia bacterium]